MAISVKQKNWLKYLNVGLWMETESSPDVVFVRKMGNDIIAHHIQPEYTVEKILKENVGSDTSLAEIKLSDLNSVIELLKVSENVERD